MCKVLYKLRLKVAVHIQQILCNQHLTVDIRTRADAEYGDFYGLGKRSRNN